MSVVSWRWVSISSLAPKHTRLIDSVTWLIAAGYFELRPVLFVSCSFQPDCPPGGLLTESLTAPWSYLTSLGPCHGVGGGENEAMLSAFDLFPPYIG